MKFLLVLALVLVLALSTEISFAETEDEVLSVDHQAARTFRCPRRCRRNRRRARRDCRRRRAIGCVIRRCRRRRARPGLRRPRRGFICRPGPTPPPPKITLGPDDDVNLGRVNVGQVTRVHLEVENMDSGTPMEDFYLLSDATLSIATGIMTVQESFIDVINERSAASADVAFGVGFYRDETSPMTDFGFVNLQSITTDTTPVLAAISTLTAIGGGDFSEANLVALTRLATSGAIGFRPEARKIVVYYGDAPGHEPTCFDGIMATRESVVAALNDAGITVAAVSFGGGLDAEPTVFGCTGETAAGVGQGTFIAEGTGGALVASDDQAGLTALILDLVATLPLEIVADTTACDGMIDITFDPPLPATLAEGESLAIKQTLTVNAGLCASSPGFSCVVKFLGSGGLLGEQTVSTSSVMRCPK